MRVREWWATRRHGPLTRDECEVCGTRLRLRQRVEITEVGTQTAEGISGGWAMTATFCTTHAPQEAMT